MDKESDGEKGKTLRTLATELVNVYEATIRILEEGIKAGKVTPMIGYLSLLAYVDMLHGGAYSVPISELPYYSFDDSKRPKLRLPPLVEAEQLEALENSGAPHVFPKLLSDQVYFLIKEYVKKIFMVDIAKMATTTLTTLVEGYPSGRSAGLMGLLSAKKAEKEED